MLSLPREGALALALAAALALPTPPAQAAGARPPPEAGRTVVGRSGPASADDVAIYALGLTGIGYRYGGTDPELGLDCSGFVRHVFQQVAGITLPRTARDMARLGSRVAPSELRAGDLVFFNTLHSPFSHVGIYVGDHRFVHAPRRGSEVQVVAMTQDYWRRRYEGARRFVDTSADIGSPARSEAREPSAPIPGEGPFGASPR